MEILVIRGAGYIDSALLWRPTDRKHCVVIMDALTYAACRRDIQCVRDHLGYAFNMAEIYVGGALKGNIAANHLDTIITLTADRHVGIAINGNGVLIVTIFECICLLPLEAPRRWRRLGSKSRKDFRFHHGWTDEAFESRGEMGACNEEATRDLRLHNSTLVSDQHARVRYNTRGLPSIVTDCSTQHSPCHARESLSLLPSADASNDKPLPVSRRGENVRARLYVEDDAGALVRSRSRTSLVFVTLPLAIVSTAFLKEGQHPQQRSDGITSCEIF